MNGMLSRESIESLRTPVETSLYETHTEEPKMDDASGPPPGSEFALQPYMKEVNALSRLSHEETMALFQALEEKESALYKLQSRQVDSPKRRVRQRHLEHELDQIKERLVTSNLRLVVYLANRYQGRRIGLEDLIQEGNIGLMRAIDKFDHHLGYRFSTYASFWIRQRMLKAIYDHGRLIHILIHMREDYRGVVRDLCAYEEQQSIGPEKVFSDKSNPGPCGTLSRLSDKGRS